MLTDLLVRALLAYVHRTPLPYGRSLLYHRVVAPLLVRRPTRSIVTTAAGDRFDCGTQDLIQRSIYAFGVWEPATSAFIASRLRPGDTFVDVGANIGYYAVVASPLVGAKGRVVAFEPSPSIRAELESNLALNACANVRVSPTAVSNVDGIAVIHRAPNVNRGSSSLLASRGFEAETSVPTAPLSRLLSAEEWATARIIKIDAEGSEGRVLEGMLDCLPQTRPDLEIVVEVSPQEVTAQGHDEAQIVRQFGELGFHAYALENLPEWRLSGRRAFKQLATKFDAAPYGDETYEIVFSRADAPHLVVALPEAPRP